MESSLGTTPVRSRRPDGQRTTVAVGARRLRELVEAERRELARELHDGLAQELAYIAAQARRLGRPGEDAAAIGARLQTAAEAGLEESRTVIAALIRPSDEPFEQTLRAVAGTAADREGVELRISLEPVGPLSSEAKHALLRAAREAVLNAARHGGARSVAITLRRRKAVALTIADDGRGFDPGQPRRSDAHGLRGIEDRVEALHGSFRVFSVGGRGTRIELTLP